MQTKRVNTALYGILLMFLLIAASCSSVKDDLESICAEATKIQQQTSLSAEEKAVEFARSMGDLSMDDNTKRFFYGLSSKESVSYNDFTTFAKENGVENWQCEPLEQLMRSE